MGLWLDLIGTVRNKLGVGPKGTTGTFDLSGLTANRTFTFPDASGTVSLGGGGSYTPPVTTKGDLFGYSTTPSRVPVGADGQVLTSDSTQALGVKWAASSGGLTAPQVVQSAYINSAPSASPTATLGTAPTPGNYLLCVMFNWTTNAPLNGYTQIQHAGTQDYAMIAWKTATSSDTATQIPYNSNSSGSLGIIYEIAGAGPINTITSVVGQTGVVSSSPLNLSSYVKSGLLIGMWEIQEFSGTPTLTTTNAGGGTLNVLATSPENNSGGTGVPRIGVGFYVNGNTKGDLSLTLSSTISGYISTGYILFASAV